MYFQPDWLLMGGRVVQKYMYIYINRKKEFLLFFIYVLWHRNELPIALNPLIDRGSNICFAFKKPTFRICVTCTKILIRLGGTPISTLDDIDGEIPILTHVPKRSQFVQKFQNSQSVRPKDWDGLDGLLATRC